MAVGATSEALMEVPQFDIFSGKFGKAAKPRTGRRVKKLRPCRRLREGRGGGDHPGCKAWPISFDMFCYGVRQEEDLEVSKHPQELLVEVFFIA